MSEISQTYSECYGPEKFIFLKSFKDRNGRTWLYWACIPVSSRIKADRVPHIEPSVVLWPMMMCNVTVTLWSYGSLWTHELRFIHNLSSCELWTEVYQVPGSLIPLTRHHLLELNKALGWNKSPMSSLLVLETYWGGLVSFNNLVPETPLQ